jgi:cytoskeleton protein RodZ
MDLGTTLRTAREHKGLSLEDLAARTKIPWKTLRAIENNDFGKIPAGLFARSFIRAYALAVGVDPSASVAEFRAMTEPTLEPVPPPREPVKIRIPPDDIESGVVRTSSLRWSLAVIVAALVISVVLLNRNTDRIGSPPAGREARPGVVSMPVEPASSEATSLTPPVQRGAVVETGIRIEMRAERLCWIRAVADGQEAFAGLMYAGQTATVTGQRDIVLRVGDPSALSYWLNGQPGAPLGTANVPVTVRFASDSMPSRVL